VGRLNEPGPAWYAACFQVAVWGELIERTTMLEDSASRSRSVPPDSTVERWVVQVQNQPRFLIQIESLSGVGAALVGVESLTGQDDVTLFTAPSGPFPSGPHLVVVSSDFQALELRSLPATDPSQVSCDISYTVRWL
jgi:hypothetical protein